MSAVEEIEAAIAKLTAIKSDSGSVSIGEDREVVYFRTDDDTDGDGNRFSFGYGVDLNDEDLASGVVTLHATIDPQLAILTDWHDRYAGKLADDYVPRSPSMVNTLALARSINEATNG